MNEGSGRKKRHKYTQNTKARDTVAVNAIGTETNTPIAYIMGPKHHLLIMSKLGDHQGQL